MHGTKIMLNISDMIFLITVFFTPHPPL